MKTSLSTLFAVVLYSGVGMGADDPEARLRRRGRAHLEGDERATRTHHVAPISARERPAHALVESLVAGRFEPLDGALHGVVGRGRSVDEREQVCNGVDHGRGA